MYLNILKKDLKRKKAMNIILLLFIILATMFVSSSVNNIINVTTDSGRTGISRRVVRTLWIAGELSDCTLSFLLWRVFDKGDCRDIEDFTIGCQDAIEKGKRETGKNIKRRLSISGSRGRSYKWIDKNITKQW